MDDLYKKVKVSAIFCVTETFEIEVDVDASEDEIDEKAREYAHDYSGKYGDSEPCCVNWEF